MRRFRVLPALALTGALFASPIAWAQDDNKPVPSFFGSTEIRKTDLKPFPKWTDMLAAFEKEHAAKAGECKVTAEEKCYYRAWTKFIAGLKGAAPAEQLEKVNAYMNQAKYVVDQVNYQVDDYWATPGQFFAKMGDCEDYAIAKYLTLLALGWDSAKLRVVAVQDMNLKIPHAVLAITQGDEVFILDNQIQQVMAAEKIKHYRPIYSVNDKSWWLHKVPPPKTS